MAIFKLIENKNPILATPLSGCSEDMNRQEMKANLIETMEHFNGIGLSANQCGIMERVFVFEFGCKKERN
jgi:peptide deformylase